MTQTTFMEPVLVAREETGPDKNEPAKIILEAVDEGLSSFGEFVKQVVYLQLKYKYGIERHEIPFKIEAFASATEEMFGNSAKLIHMKIIGKLHVKTGGFLYVPKREDFTFKDYVKSLRYFLKNSVNV
jgi:hypothetical protein